MDYLWMVVEEDFKIEESIVMIVVSGHDQTNWRKKREKKVQIAFLFIYLWWGDAKYRAKKYVHQKSDRLKELVYFQFRKITLYWNSR